MALSQTIRSDAKGPATTPVIANISVPVANTEQSYLFPIETKRFAIKSRMGSTIKFAFESGASSTEFMTVSAGSSYEENGVVLSDITLYFQTSKGSDTIEILSWS